MVSVKIRVEGSPCSRLPLKKAFSTGAWAELLNRAM